MLLRNIEVNDKKLIKPAKRINSGFLWENENR